MPNTTRNDTLFRIIGWLTWLDAIDAGPHPMDPLRVRATKKALAASAIRDLADRARDGEAGRRFFDIAGRLLLEAGRDMQGAATDNDDDEDQDKWHPFIPKWGGGPDFQSVSPSVTRWLETLTPAASDALLEGAIATIHHMASARPGRQAVAD